MGDLVELTDYRARRLLSTPAARPPAPRRSLDDEAASVLNLLRLAQSDLESAITEKAQRRLGRIKQSHCLVKLAVDALERGIEVGRVDAQEDLATYLMLALGLRGGEGSYVGAERAIECVAAILRTFSESIDSDAAV